jgi:hypothetical protein
MVVAASAVERSRMVVVASTAEAGSTVVAAGNFEVYVVTGTAGSARCRPFLCLCRNLDLRPVNAVRLELFHAEPSTKQA